MGLRQQQDEPHVVPVRDVADSEREIGRQIYRPHKITRQRVLLGVKAGVAAITLVAVTAGCGSGSHTLKILRAQEAGCEEYSNRVIKVSDGTGKVIATYHGKGVRSHYDWGSGRCDKEFKFNVPDADVYIIDYPGYLPVTFSKSELEAKKWTLR